MSPVRTMANLETEFHEPLTRLGANRDEKITIRSSDFDRPKDYKQNRNFGLFECDLKMEKFLANVVSFNENLYE